MDVAGRRRRRGWACVNVGHPLCAICLRQHHLLLMFFYDLTCCLTVRDPGGTVAYGCPTPYWARWANQTDTGSCQSVSGGKSSPTTGTREQLRTTTMNTAQELKRLWVWDFSPTRRLVKTARRTMKLWGCRHHHHHHHKLTDSIISWSLPPWSLLLTPARVHLCTLYFLHFDPTGPASKIKKTSINSWINWSDERCPSVCPESPCAVMTAAPMTQNST